MAAYSAVAVFRHTLEQLLGSEQFPPHVSKSQITFLHENVCSLQSSLEKIPLVPKSKGEKMKDLQTRIREAIYAAQDEVDYWVRGHSPHEMTMKKLEVDIQLVEKDAADMEQETRDAQDVLAEDPVLVSDSFKISGRDKIVGHEEDFKTVIDCVQSEVDALVVIPIIGLPGIGKTTLARSIYSDKRIRESFMIQAWAHVSQGVDYQTLLLKILSSINIIRGYEDDKDKLLLKLYETLYGKKYLIVLDDVWDSIFWDQVRSAFPDNKNGSRILLTTRFSTVAATVKTSSFVHEMKPLGLEHSWELLCYRVFGDKLEDYKDEITKACPAHLKDTGRRIADNCKGLPLSITVIGGLLSRERLDPDYWKRIEQDTAGFAATGDVSYMEILSLSYNNLPAYLKGCFLYMGAFPEDAEIRVSKLIKLWVAEGFFPKPSLPTQTMELVAHKALEDLIGRNLIAISEKSSNGGIKVCRMQNSLRQLAEIESGKEKFFHCRKKYNQILEEGMKKQRRVSVHINLLMSLEEVYEATKTITSARTLLYLGPHHHHPLPYCLTFDLLKVLDAFTVYFVEFPDEFFQLVHLTYLSLTYNDELPPEISLLQKLQVLMVRRKPKLIFIGVSFLPDEIWEMPELRHLWFTEIDFPALPQNIPQNKALLLNLQTLSYINAASCTRDVLRRMPSLKKLSVWAEAPGVIGLYLDELEQLEAFKFTVLHPSPNKQVEFEPEISFPQTLRKLSLSGCGLRWDAMEVVAALPNLEVLKLRELAFNGEEWCLENHCVFEKLKFMLIEYLNFKRWSADHTHFPGLERLYLRHCYELEEIPSDIGFIGTLGLIELVDCSPQAVESAEVIKQEQEVDGGRQGFQVRIYCSYE
ncbi:putative late blight resistance protein homolog R1A-3 [Salvia splendens]|uniref:putative late blight resistance protein homolog R1A-3 n=1 Tax=Salvia splendens TaxID=180675 RepID=UPI001C26EB9D|nr:putative late blight resistance protein homolog R1A-3 [Salvia splendens]